MVHPGAEGRVAAAAARAASKPSHAAPEAGWLRAAASRAAREPIKVFNRFPRVRVSDSVSRTSRTSFASRMEKVLEIVLVVVEKTRGFARDVCLSRERPRVTPRDDASLDVSRGDFFPPRALGPALGGETENRRRRRRSQRVQRLGDAQTRHHGRIPHARLAWLVRNLLGAFFLRFASLHP